MQRHLHHLITATVLVAALTLYYFGTINDVGALLLAGAACELWFWMRATAKRPPAQAAA